MVMFDASPMEDAEYVAWRNSPGQRVTRSMRSIIGADIIAKVVGFESRLLFNIGIMHGDANCVIGYGIGELRNPFQLFSFATSCNFHEIVLLNHRWVWARECSTCQEDIQREYEAQKRVVDASIFAATGRHVFEDEEPPDEHPVAVGATPPTPNEPKDGAMLEWP